MSRTGTHSHKVWRNDGGHGSCVCDIVCVWGVGVGVGVCTEREERERERKRERERE